MDNPLASYREWFLAQYVVWADMIASAAMDNFDALYRIASIDAYAGEVGDPASGLAGPDGRADGAMAEYVKGKHTTRLLDYIDATLAKRNVGLTALVASILYETTEAHMPPLMGLLEYRHELDTVRFRYHQALADGDAEAIEAEEDILDMLEEDFEARKLMNDTWYGFTRWRFNLDTIAAYTG